MIIIINVFIVCLQMHLRYASKGFLIYEAGECCQLPPVELIQGEQTEDRATYKQNTG